MQCVFSFMVRESYINCACICRWCVDSVHGWLLDSQLECRRFIHLIYLSFFNDSNNAQWAEYGFNVLYISSTFAGSNHGLLDKPLTGFSHNQTDFISLWLCRSHTILWIQLIHRFWQHVSVMFCFNDIPELTDLNQKQTMQFIYIYIYN